MSGHKKKADKKVVILGDSGVGKTSLIRRYIEGTYSEGMSNTIGAAFFLKQWNGYNIALWDTAGQEEFSGLTNFYCRSANAVILCYDIYDKASFEALDGRHSSLLETVANQCVMVFVGTKIDLLNQKKDGTYMPREVSPEESLQKALEFNERWDSKKHPSGMPPSFETSSKQNKNVNDVFDYIFESILPNSRESIQRTISPSGVIQLSPSDRKTNGENFQKKSKCCSS